MAALAKARGEKLDRNPKTGRFLPGHKPYIAKNPGRKPKAVEQAYLEILRKKIPEKDWKEMIDAIATISRGKGKSKMGWDKLKPADIIKAFATIAGYLIGAPKQKTEMVGDLEINVVWREETNNEQ